MKPVKQIDVSLETGECLRACIASILELELEDVPHFITMGDTWFIEMKEWFAERNIYLWHSNEFIPFGTWHIATVDSPRFDGVQHAVVCDPNGIIVHDPHPEVDDPTINGDTKGWYWFNVIDPARMVG